MPRAGPKKVHRYSLEFKLTAVKLSQVKGVQVQAVADAGERHWRHVMNRKTIGTPSAALAREAVE